MISFLKSLWDALFQSLGLSNRQGNLLLLGLDNAGKTTLLHRLRTGNLPQNFPPTDRPSQNEFRHGRIQFQAWDMGGHEAVRHMWMEYFEGGSASTGSKLAILFCIDAADPARVEEAGYELDNLLIHNIKNENAEGGESINGGGSTKGSTKDDEDAPPVPPVAILLNKCDLEDQALSTSEICERIDYQNLVQQYSSERVAIFRISVLRGEGYQDAFQWISNFL